MYGSSELTELYLYVGQGYFKAFSSCIQKYFGDKVHYAFSSAFYLEPNVEPGDPTKLEDMLGHKEEDIFRWQETYLYMVMPGDEWLFIKSRSVLQQRY